MDPLAVSQFPVIIMHLENPDLICVYLVSFFQIHNGCVMCDILVKKLNNYNYN